MLTSIFRLSDCAKVGDEETTDRAIEVEVAKFEARLIAGHSAMAERRHLEMGGIGRGEGRPEQADWSAATRKVECGPTQSRKHPSQEPIDRPGETRPWG